MSEADDLFEVPPSPVMGGAGVLPGEPHYGSPDPSAPVSLDPWARPAVDDGAFITRRYPRTWSATDEELAAAFPRAWPTLGSQRPAGGHDDLFVGADGVSGSLRWDRFLSELERLEYDLMQRRAAERVPACSACGQVAALDKSGRCAFGCEVSA